MPITRRYSPPFQASGPRPGAQDAGATIKGLISVEVARTNEVSFAVESFGCDGKPVLSMLRGLPCETSGDLVVAGTKNGMPFKLNGDLPRTLGSAIRGAGGALRTVTGGTSLRTMEWVLYDSVGNCWSLDDLTGGNPTYLGETPALAGEAEPAVCEQAPFIRPYELRWEYINAGGDPPSRNVRFYPAGAGWIKDSDPSPVIAWPVAYPYAAPTNYFRIEQWIPDETEAPPGGAYAGAWPGSKWMGECTWYPGSPTSPNALRSDTENSIDVVVSKYAGLDPGDPYGTTVWMNRWTRPLLEHISVGGTAAEALLLICVEKDLRHSPYLSRVSLYRRSTGALLATSANFAPAVVGRDMFTPDVPEGWLYQTAAVTDDTITIRRFRSRASSTDAYGSALTEAASIDVTIPATAAHPWGADPVWFRVGRIIRYLSTTPRLAPLLPRWR